MDNDRDIKFDIVIGHHFLSQVTIFFQASYDF
jgi:hypothetical protein